MSGAIMPEPLAMPAMWIGRLRPARRAAAPLGKVSVVMIAGRPFRCRLRPAHRPDRGPTLAVMLFIGQRLADHAGRGRKDPAGRNAQRRGHGAGDGGHGSSSPTLPVKALELPEFTMIAAPAPRDLGASLAWQSRTQPDRVEDRVKAPAMAVPGASRTSITSLRFWYLTPARWRRIQPPLDRGQGRETGGASGETGFIAFFAADHIVASETVSDTASPPGRRRRSAVLQLADLLLQRLRFGLPVGLGHGLPPISRSGPSSSGSSGRSFRPPGDRRGAVSSSIFASIAAFSISAASSSRMSSSVGLAATRVSRTRIRCQPKSDLHRAGLTSPDLGGDHGILERLDHHAQAEPAQIAALRARPGVGRLGLGQFGKIGAAASSVLIASASSSVSTRICAALYSFAGLGVLEAFVIGRLQRLVGHGGFDHDPGSR
jgi:hypothetical protein